MNTQGQAAPPVRPPVAAARRFSIRALRVLLAVPVLGVLFLFLLWLRLCWGPIQLGWLAHRLAPGSVAGEALGFDRVWLQRGESGAIVLGATSLVLHRPVGGPDAGDDLKAGRAELSLGLASLLSGRVAIEELSIRDASVRLKRAPDGAVSLDGVAPSPSSRGGGSGTGRVSIDRLRQVRIDRLAVTLVDQATQRRFGVRVEQAVLSPWHELASGSLRAALSVDGQEIPLGGEGVPTAAGLDWHLRGGAIKASAFADLVPALSAIALPVTPTAEMLFRAGDLRPDRLHLLLDLGAGELKPGDGTVPVAGGQVALLLRRAGATGVAATLEQVRLALAAPAGAASGDAPVFTGSGTMSVDDVRAPERIRAQLTVDSASVGFAGVARYWPLGVAPGARRWITENITAGVATGLHVETALAGDHGWSSLREVRRTGGFDAHDMEMWWLRPMPPLQRMRAHLTFQGSDALLVESSGATLPVEAVGPEAIRLAGADALAPLAVSDGSMRITGLDAAQQIGTVHLTLSGGVRELMCALANPRLSLLSKHPVSFTAPGGETRSEVTVSLPLDNKVAIEDVSVSSRSVMRGVHLGNVAGGLALDDADLTLSADTSGLVLDGEGAVGPIDSQLHYQMDFQAGPPEQLVEQATVQGTVGGAALSGLGFDAGSALSGNGGLALQYAARRDGRSTVRLNLDMTGMAIALPVWSKQAGQAGSVDATVVLDHGHLLSVGPIHADGPALSIEGDVSTPPTGPRLLRVPRFLLGRTRGAGEVSFPRAGGKGTAEPIRLSAHGPVLDLAAIVDARSGGATTAKARPDAVAAGKGKAKAAGGGSGASSSAGPAWTADLRFNRVFVGRKTALGGVSAHLENDGRILVAARVDASDPTRLSVRLRPDGSGRSLDGTAADTGLLLRGLGVTDQVSGGVLHLSARLPGSASTTAPSPPMTGTVEIGRFVLPDAPLAARIIRDLSIYGWLLALRAPQLQVDHLVAPFSLDGDVLTLIDARAHAPALGVTMQGAVDLGRQRLDLRGTVVPAWALNQLPGRLPLLGRLLAPEKGGGVLAVTLGIKGPFDEPRISVDPLSALAPGFLRKLFFD